MIVSKYLDADAIKKLTMACKKFGGTLKTLHFNPIPLTNKKTRELFPNMETQYIYSKDDMIFKDGKIKKHQIEGSGAYSWINYGNRSIINFYAFQNWKPDIKTICISPTVTAICPMAFAQSSIEHIIIHYRVKLRIENMAFNNSSLKSITLPPSPRRTQYRRFSLM